MGTAVETLRRRRFQSARAEVASIPDDALEARSQTFSWDNLMALLSPPPTKTGVLVSEGNAMTYTAVFAAVRILAESLGTLPMMVYERLDRGKRRAPEHPVYDLVHNAPNPDMTACVFKETVQGHLALWGNGYSRLIPGPDGRIKEIRPRMPSVTTPVRMPGGDRRYITQDDDGRQEILYRDEVLHIPGLGFDGLRGMSPIRYAREAIGLGLAAEEFGGTFFSQGANAGGVLEHPESLSPEALEHLRASFAARNAGLGNAHKPLILEEGMKFNKIGIPPDDAQFLETRKFQVTEIARIYRIPPHMLADLDRATFSNIEHMSLEFVKYTLLPWLTKWEQELTRKLFLPDERGRFFIEFLVDDLLRADFVTRMNGYHLAIQDGHLNRNEVRELENRNPVEGGDVYLVPTNLMPSEDLGKTPPPGPVQVGTKPDEPPPDQEDEEEEDEEEKSAREALAAKAERVLADEIDRIGRRVTDRLARAEKRFTGPADRTIWLDANCADEEARSAEALALRASIHARLRGFAEPDVPAFLKHCFTELRAGRPWPDGTEAVKTLNQENDHDHDD